MKLHLLNAASTFTELHLINSYEVAFYKMQLWVWYLKKKKKGNLNRSEEPLNNKKTLNRKNDQAHSHHQAQIDHFLLWTLKQTLILNTTPPPLPLIDATAALRTDCHRHRLEPLC